MSIDASSENCLKDNPFNMWFCSGIEEVSHRYFEAVMHQS